MGALVDLRSRSESEKITINLGYVDLGQIDLLVEEGFYSNRTDFIRTAIRNQLDRYADTLRKSVKRKRLDLGLRLIDRKELEEARRRGETIDIHVVGLAVIDQDVSIELARNTIDSIHVLGALQATSELKAALKDRIH